MKRLLLMVALILVLVTACNPTSQSTVPFPPPEGYSSWEEYNQAQQQQGESPTATTTQVFTTQQLMTTPQSSTQTQQATTAPAKTTSVPKIQLTNDNWNLVLAEAKGAQKSFIGSHVTLMGRSVK